MRQLVTHTSSLLPEHNISPLFHRANIRIHFATFVDSPRPRSLGPGERGLGKASRWREGVESIGTGWLHVEITSERQRSLIH
jgi:hypothetical protein